MLSVAINRIADSVVRFAFERLKTTDYFARSGVCGLMSEVCDLLSTG